MNRFNLSALAVLLSTVGNALIDFSETLETDAEDAPEPEAKPTKPTGRGKAKPAAEEEPAPAKPAGRGKTKAKPEPEPEPENTDEDPISLEDLQELAATLLENSQRKVLQGILTDFQIKTLSAAEEDQFDDLYDALYDAVEKLG